MFCALIASQDAFLTKERSMQAIDQDDKLRSAPAGAKATASKRRAALDRRYFGFIAG